VPSELMRDMSELYMNGGVLFARLAVSSDPRLDWFVMRSRVHHIKLIEHLLASNTLLTALPEVRYLSTTHNLHMSRWWTKPECWW
jgi:hypothetical protein